MDILSKILNYESRVFNEYTTKRQLMLSDLSCLNICTLDKDQINVFIHDLKCIIDPVKTSISEIDYYFTNKDFKKTDNLKHLEQLKTISLLYFLLNQSETDDTETPESDSDSDSDKSSESVSLSVSELASSSDV